MELIFLFVGIILALSVVIAFIAGYYSDISADSEYPDCWTLLDRCDDCPVDFPDKAC